MRGLVVKSGPTDVMEGSTGKMSRGVFTVNESF